MSNRNRWRLTHPRPASWVPLSSLAAMAQAADPTATQSAASQPSQLGEVVVHRHAGRNRRSAKSRSASAAYTEQTMDIRGSNPFADISRYVPGVTFSPTSKNIAIRGVSSGAGAGTTGIYIDDTPIQLRSIGFSANNSLPAVFDPEPGGGAARAAGHAVRRGARNAARYATSRLSPA